MITLFSDKRNKYLKTNIYTVDYIDLIKSYKMK